MRVPRGGLLPLTLSFQVTEDKRMSRGGCFFGSLVLLESSRRASMTALAPSSMMVGPRLFSFQPKVKIIVSTLVKRFLISVESEMSPEKIWTLGEDSRAGKRSMSLGLERT